MYMLVCINRVSSLCEVCSGVCNSAIIIIIVLLTYSTAYIVGTLYL